jgi:AraC-like DNA-binding protein
VGDRTKPTAASARPATASTVGVLHPDELARHVELDRNAAGPGVDRWVENHWSLAWDLPDGRWFPSQVLSHPTCSLTIELGSHPRPALPHGETVVITGVATRRFDVAVRGWGRVVGVRFRPGGLPALSGRSAAAWTDRVVPARDVLPADVCTALGDPELADSPGRWAAAAETALAGIPTRPDPRYEQLLAVVADVLADRSLLTVADVSRRHGVAPRTLQRLFTRYVGVGPKWVLARYRMHDVVSEIDEGYAGRLSDLAHRYGWYDQAHFTRDFTSLVGVTPGQYRDRRDGAR